ncbi:unnamed protein product, partial [marine sediment metagenome]
LIGFGIAIVALLWFFMDRVGKGKIESIRRLPIIDAIDEAIDRSTEQGRPVLMTYGPNDNLSPPGLVGLDAVYYVAQKTAEAGTELYIPVSGPRTLPIALENYRMGCLKAGAPELFKETNVRYMGRGQFSYTSGIMGLMESHKPGACIFLGPFLVEGVHLGVQKQRIDTMGIAG